MQDWVTKYDAAMDAAQKARATGNYEAAEDAAIIALRLAAGKDDEARIRACELYLSLPGPSEGLESVLEELGLLRRL